MKELFRNHYLIAFFSTLVISVGLLITSFFLPPTGQVDPSAMRATAELMFWPALAFAAKALDDGKVAKLKHGHTSITVGEDIDGDDDESPEEEIMDNGEV